MEEFQRVFEEIDTDGSGELTTQELEEYMTKRNYKPEFKQKWLTLFDSDGDGVITYKEFCDTLGLIPKKEVIEKAEKVKSERKLTEIQQQPIVCQTARVVGHAATPSRKKQDETDQESRKNKNYEISADGIMRFSKNRIVEKKKLHRYTKTSGVDKTLKRLQKSLASITSKQDTQVETSKTKPIGGDNNGGERTVPVSKTPRHILAENPPKKKHLRRNPVFSEHKRRLKAGLVPGSILILLSGIHRGKRVVFLKQLKSGLLLVTGPYKMNGCPLRRVNQIYTITTAKRLDLSGLDIPKRLNDVYFKRTPKKDGKKKTGEIFADDDVKYTASEERKQDQKTVDSQIIERIKKDADKKLVFQYLASLFSLSKKDYPHKMKF